MTKRLPLITGFVLLIAGAVCYWYEPPFMVGLSQRSFDVFLRQNAVPVQTDAVAVVDIDEASLEQCGQWPWPRTRIAELVSTLWEKGAAVVVFDVIFIEPDRTAPAELFNTWKEDFGANVQISGLSSNLWDFDAVFAGALAQGPVVLGCFMNGTSGPLSEMPPDEADGYRGRFFELGQTGRVWLPQADGLLRPIAALSESSAGTGFINTLPDADGIIRRTPMVFAYGPGRLYPSLSLEAARIYTEARKVGIVYYPQGGGVQEIRLLDRVVPTDARGQMTINYRATRFPRYSAADVLDGSLVGGVLQDKVVLVGTSAAGLQDLVSTPLQSAFPGVEVHATVMDNLLAGDILRQPDWMFGVGLLVMLVSGLIVTLLVVYTSAVLSFLVMLFADVAVLAACGWLLKVKQMVVFPAETLAVWGVVFAGVTAVKYLQEESGRKKVRRMFGTMVSPSVLRFLEQNPGSFSLTGARTEATVFFSDVAGFTTISERLEPARLVELLNRYLSPMTDIIMARGGYVDKYEGDAIMAEWGVPFTTKDHAAQACFAALEQKEILEKIQPELKKEFDCELSVRMGINTGMVAAGNMGSMKRFQYTVMGDVVNQAARFESANKRYGSVVIIGETTCKQVHELFETRLLDRAVVKGKTEPVRLYELLGRAGDLSEEKRRVVERYEAALKMHWERKFNEAAGELNAILSEGEDPPSRWLYQRVLSYIEAPPPDHWTGECSGLDEW